MSQSIVVLYLSVACVVWGACLLGFGWLQVSADGDAEVAATLAFAIAVAWPLSLPTLLVIAAGAALLRGFR